MAFRASLEKKEEKERVRAELMRAALRLGAAHGFSSLGLREVAREAGIAPTSFYRHFADMEELGMAIIRELAGRVLRGWGDRAADAATSGEVAGALLDAMLGAVAHDPELMRFIVMERVGAFAGFRALLRAELLQLSGSVQATRTDPDIQRELPPWAADAAVMLLIEGCLRALDEAPARLAGLRASLLQSIAHLLRTHAPAATEVPR